MKTLKNQCGEPEQGLLFALRFHRKRTPWLKPCNRLASARANSL